MKKLETLETLEADARRDMERELIAKADALASEIREDIANGEARWLIVHKRRELNRMNSLLRG